MVKTKKSVTYRLISVTNYTTVTVVQALEGISLELPTPKFVDI